MKLLVASDYDSVHADLKQQLEEARRDVELTLVKTTEEILHAVSTNRYDAVITEYAVDTLDIWKLATLIRSPRLAQASPLILVKESCNTEIPTLLANEFRFKMAGLHDIPDLLISQPFDFRPGLLIIEDNHYAADSALHALKDQFEVTIAYDGETGFACWEEQRHAVVLLDLMLPDMAGDYVLNKILSVDESQAVIVVTAYTSLDNHRVVLLSGACDFLCKPYSLAELRMQCNAALKKATLFCQSTYHRTQYDQLSIHLYLLDYHLSRHNVVKCQALVQSMQTLLPNSALPDDVLEKLLQ